MRTSLVLVILVLGCCSSSTDMGVDAGAGADAGMDSGAESDSGADSGSDSATETDSGSDSGADAGVESDSSIGTCGSTRADVSSVTGTEGLVIGRDGTIYYSQDNAVGRLVAGASPDPSWVLLGEAASTVWGLALDAANEKLYVGSPSAAAIYEVVVATGEHSVLYPTAGQPNGLTMGPDGALYYSDFGGGRVYRVDVTDGSRTQVTTSTISQANGLAFGSDGRLYVVSYASGQLFALTLVAGAETARQTIASSLGNPDGLAFDSSGRIYVGDNGGDRLLRLDADGTNPMVLASRVYSAANVEFGAGPLSCSDIYVASSGELFRFEAGSTAGAAVPWH